MQLAFSLVSILALQFSLGPAAAGAIRAAPPPAWAESSEPGEFAVIAGIVVDLAGRPVGGARVSIAGTQALATTGQDGKFRLDAAEGAEVVLSVVAIGYRPLTQRVRVGEVNLRLTLTDAVINLEEVVVTGTTAATQRKQLGNAVATISAADALQIAPPGSLGQLLNGRAAGVTVQPRSGFVGSGPRIKVRGAATFFLGTEPLIYIDGVRADSRASTTSGYDMGGRNAETVNRLNDINPEDIESIEIIRGPAAATLYGTEASNGVVQVITKKGQAGAKPEFEVTTRQGANWFRNPEGRLPDVYSRDAAGAIVNLNILEREAAAGRPFFRTGYSRGYTANVRGGTDQIQYFGSVGWDDDEGVEPTNTADRFSSRLNLGLTPSNKLQINASLGLSSGRIDIPWSDNLFSMLYADASLLDTPYRGFFEAPPEVYWRNVETRQDYRRSTFSIDATHRIRPWLTQRLRAGLDLANEDNKALNRRMNDEDGQFFGLDVRLGSIRQERVASTNRTVDYNISATAKLRPDLVSTTTFGAQYFRRRLQAVNSIGLEFPASGVETVSAAAVRRGSEDFEENATVGVFGQGQLAWKDRFFLTAAVRGDDNSAFGRDYDFVVYPKVGLSWAISEEPFWPKGFAERFRIRAAYGAAGQQPSTFAAVQTYRPVTGGDGGSSISRGSFGNANLKPERSRELELGFEGAFLKDRIGVDVSFYRKVTSDAILLLPVAPSAGFTGSQFVNAGEILTRGIEAQLTGQVIDKQNVKWALGLNISKNDSKVQSLGGADFVAQDVWSGFKVGYPVSSYFQRRVVSATRTSSGEIENILCDAGPGAAPVPCANAPRQFMGRQVPKVEGAVTTDLLLFGRLRFYGMIDFKRGHRLWSADNAVFCLYLPRCRENYYPDEFDAVRLAYVQTADDAFVEPWIQDAGFFKLRELSLSYTLPERVARLVSGKRATLTVAGRNLAQWGTKYWGWDPEAYAEFARAYPQPFGTQDNLRATNADISTLPPLAQFMVTLRVAF